MVSEHKKPFNPAADYEIDLIPIAKTLWLGKRTIIKWTLIGGIAGLIIALTTPKEFVATSILVPSGYEGVAKLSAMSGLGGLAAMAGINLNTSGGTDLSPIVYPKIVTSVPFHLELMNTPLNFKEIGKPVTLQEYYSDYQKPNLFLKYTVGLPGIIISALKGEEKEAIRNIEGQGPIELSAVQQNIHAILMGSLSLEVDPKEGVLILTSVMPEALPAAQLGERAQQLLQKYITEFKIKKSKANLNFIQQRFDETALKYEALQQRLATFRDRNKNVSLATVRTEEERLTSQYNLTYNVYNELAKQLEQAKIQVKQDTPVFTIIEPVSVPTKKSKPNRPFILIICLLLGSLTGTLFVFGSSVSGTIRQRWKEGEQENQIQQIQ